MFNPDDVLHAAINNAIVESKKLNIATIVDIVGKHAIDKKQRMELCDIFLSEYKSKVHHHGRDKIDAEIEFKRLYNDVFDKCVEYVDREKAMFEEEGLVMDVSYLKCFLLRYSVTCDHAVLLNRLYRYYGL